jgi:hypothetical protein
MNTLVSILSQLFWGVTVGALTAAATALVQFALVGFGALVAGAAAWRWRARRRKRD